jgi:hypothetical protein
MVRVSTAIEQLVQVKGCRRALATACAARVGSGSLAFDRGDLVDVAGELIRRQSIVTIVISIIGSPTL